MRLTETWTIFALFGALTGVAMAEPPTTAQSERVVDGKDIIIGQGDFFVVGNEANQNIWYYDEFDIPEDLKDRDGGTIRLIMQHEWLANDDVRVVDIAVGCEHNGDEYYAHVSKQPGLRCWFQPNIGAPLSGSLGDTVGENYASPWEWAYITDYKLHDDWSILGGERLRLYAHPDVTVRVRIID